MLEEASLRCVRRHAICEDRRAEQAAFTCYFSSPRQLRLGGVVCIPFLPLPGTRGGQPPQAVAQAAPPPSRYSALCLCELQCQWYSVVGIKGEGCDAQGCTGPQTRIILSSTTLAGARRNARLPDYDVGVRVAVAELNGPPPRPLHLHALYDRHCQRLLPCLHASMASRLGPLGAFPVLIHCPSAEDVRVSLLECAKRLGLMLVVLNARHLLGGPAETVSEPRSQWAHPSVVVATQAHCTAAFVASWMPCLVFVDQVDQCVHDLAAAARGENGPPDSPLASRLEALLGDVTAQAQALALAADSEESGTGGDDDDDCLVLFAAHSWDASALGGSLRGLFTCDCRLEPLSEEEVAGAVSEWEVGAGAETAMTVALGVGDTAGVARFLSKEVKALGGSVEALRVLLQATALAAVQRVRGDYWLDMSELYEAIHPGAGLYGDVQGDSLDSLDAGCSRIALTVADAKTAVLASSAALANRTGAAPTGTANVSPVRWADIGGLDRVRKEILDVLQLPLLRPDLFPTGCPMRRAVLLYGPPGTGKTLVARAVATECDMAFFSVKGPELLDIYVGESERNVRKVFDNARSLAPAVLFFDELDSLAPARGRGGDAGGVMDRVVSQLLTEMDALSVAGSAQGVFVMGATNRPDLLDAALLRPGRFDRKVYLSVCKEASVRRQILQAQLRTVSLAADVDLDRVAEGLPARITGADIGAITSAAYGAARERKLQELQREAVAALEGDGAPTWRAHPADPSSPTSTRTSIPTSNTGPVSVWAIAAYVNALPSSRLDISVTAEDLDVAARRCHLSVSEAELVTYEALGRQFDNT